MRRRSLNKSEKEKRRKKGERGYSLLSVGAGKWFSSCPDNAFQMVLKGQTPPALAQVCCCCCMARVDLAKACRSSVQADATGEKERDDGQEGEESLSCVLTS